MHSCLRAPPAAPAPWTLPGAGALPPDVARHLAAWAAGGAWALAFPAASGLVLTAAGAAAAHELQARLCHNDPDPALDRGRRGFYLPAAALINNRVRKRAERVVAELARAGGGTAPPHALLSRLLLHPGGGGGGEEGAALARAATRALPAPLERQSTGKRESHVWERGDEVAVTAGALSRHLAALAMMARYGPRCSLLIALMVDVVEYYRLWGNRRELTRERWPAAQAAVPLCPLLPPRAQSGGAPRAPPADAVLLDKLLAALRQWVPLLPLRQGPARTALLRDLGAYIVAAWDCQ
jgi:hypothetical protein